MGFQSHCRKLLYQNNEYTIPRGSASYSPALSPSLSPSPSPSPHQYDSSLSFHHPIIPKIPVLPILPVHYDNWFHTHILQVGMIVLGCTLGFVTLLCIVSIIRRHYYYSRRRNHMRGNTPILFYVNGDSPVSGSDGDDDGPIIDHPIWLIRTEGLQQSIIDSITVFIYRKDEKLTDGTECSVCLGEFQDDESLRLLPKCSHAFHTPCIDTWLRSHKNCPLCRAPVVHDATGGSGSAEVRRVTEAGSSVSVENQEMSTGIENHQLAESESSAVRVVDDDGGGGGGGVSSSEDHGGSGETLDKVLPNFDNANCDSSIIIMGSHDEVESEEEIQPIRRSVSMDSSNASAMFQDLVLDLSSDQDSMDTQLGDRINSKGKDMKVEKRGSESSTTICKFASIGQIVLQKRPISLRSSLSSSHNRKSLSSRHCRSQSSTLPL